MGGYTRESMKTVGRHLIAEFYGCESRILNDAEGIGAALRTAAGRVGATVVGEVYHRFRPRGVTGVVLIAESHLSIHTWPDQRYVAVDVFTCGGLDPRPACEFLGDVLGAEEDRFQEILRGLPEELDEDAPFLPRDVLVVTRMNAARKLGRSRRSH